MTVVSGASGATRRWMPGPDDIVDAVCVLVLVAIALLGFDPVFDGFGAVLAGGAGILAAFIGVWVTLVLRLKGPATIAVLALTYLLFSGPAVPDSSLAGVLPGPGTPGALLGGLANGWADLVTTAPPVGLSGGLGVVPYTCGFLATALAFLIARRTDHPVLPLVPVLLVLAVVVALGTHQPASVLMQGGMMILVGLGWAAVRSNRDRRTSDGSIYWPRIAAGSAMLGVVAVAGLVGASSLPFVDTADRYMVREHVVPPFDPRDYPSPLAAFQSYKLERADEVLMSVDGFPEGGRIRLATMDAYDGVVWMATSGDAAGAGRFERVGRRVLPVPPGDRHEIEVRIGAYHDVWVPTVGATESIQFGGGDASDLFDAFRYNRTTGTGASPVFVREGDAYALAVSVPMRPEDEDLQKAAVMSVALPAMPSTESMLGTFSKFQDKGLGLVGEASSPFAQALELEQALQSHAYSDGGPEATGSARSPAGHSLFRIDMFLDANQFVGNGEQYAAAMALMARQLGLPARVVVGFAPEGEGAVDVTGSDADAWVEIAFEGAGWVPFFPTPSEENQPDEERTESKVEDQLSTQEPPPDDYLEPPEEPEELDRRGERDEQAVEVVEASAGFGLPRPLVLGLTYGGPPVAVVGVVMLLIVGAKGVRRRRRRTRGTTVDRIAAAWKELADQLRDQGHSPPRRATRRETAASVSAAWATGPTLAGEVDGLMFASTEPGVADAEELWHRVEEERASLRQPLTRKERLKAAVSLASLKPGRDR